MKSYKSPLPTVDIIIEIEREDEQTGIVLIKRKNPPYGWALPGGFVDYGESLEEAALREAKEETSLRIRLCYQMHTYSDPKRDPRKHTITTVYVATDQGKPIAQDDAADIGIFQPDKLETPLAFDHEKIIRDYLEQKEKKSY